MNPGRLLVVLTLLFSFDDALGGWFDWMLDSTCDTIKDQLRSIDNKITEMEATPTTNNPTPYRLNLFLQSYDQSINNGKAYKHEMHTFVLAKLNEFSIPVVGLLDDASQLKKVFQHVEDRKKFYEQLLLERQEEYNVLREEKKKLEKLITVEEGKKNAYNGNIKTMEGKISEKQLEKQQLQAKINGNPPAIQG